MNINCRHYLPYLLIPAVFLLLFFGKDLIPCIIHTSPVAEEVSPSILMLSDKQKAILQSGGTWSELFPMTAPQNVSQFMAVIIWWSFCSLFAWIIYPIVRKVFNRLSDHGFPLSRLSAFLLFSYTAWIAGSSGIRITRMLLVLLLIMICLLSLFLLLKDRKVIIEELIQKRSYYLLVEFIALIAFTLFLYIRFKNPDLWHLYFGGEKPMDFAYFNAVLKSEIYPPYDPWFAGGQMNYYYLGFVLIGMPVKLLGITPGVAYNLLLPTLYSFAVLGAFSIGWNLVRIQKWIGGLCSSMALTFFGNLGAVRMVWLGWQRMSSAPESLINNETITNIIHAISGAKNWILGQSFPYSAGDWYWTPSRSIVPAPGAEITEFPLFTFLYADLHAHLIALPVTLLVIIWSLAIIKTDFSKEKNADLIIKLSIGSLIVGSLRAINAWDQPTFLLFSSLSLLYSLLRSRTNQGISIFQIFLYSVYFIGMSFLLYTPFYLTFQQGYSDILLWEGDKVNLPSYIVHFGLFIFVLCAYLIYKVIHWMSKTPISVLKKLTPYRAPITGAAILGVFVLALLLFNGIEISIIVLPMLLICGFLFVQKDQNPQTRFLLFLGGTGLLITLVVDIITIQGDRMNTTFKFYFQAWTFLSISAGVALAHVIRKAGKWNKVYQGTFYGILFILIAGCTLTTITSMKSKMNDRITDTAPSSLDGMIFMDYTTLLDGPPDGNLQGMDLSADAQAIRWVQQNIPGSPVIVEAHTQEYRHWGNRFSIYTGLPGVIGWANHQRQQRAVLGEDQVGKRIEQVELFYRTDDITQAAAFLQKYEVAYIIVGQLERIYYPASGLEKFSGYSGTLWELIYSDGQTNIYKVLNEE